MALGAALCRTLALCLIGITTVVALSVELRAPRFVVHRHSAVLRCEHSADPQYVYKVVFYKDGHRIMQYVNGRDPPFEIYNVTGIDIRLATLSSTTLTLDNMDFSTSGSYACEITLETPIYSKVSNLHDITVIVRQKHRPKIKIRNFKFSTEDILEASCQSSPAHPAPHLTWFINNVKVDERMTTPNGVTNVHRYHHGMPLQSTNTSLHYPVSRLQQVANETVDITCLSTIPSYASIDGFVDLQNHTITVNVKMAPAPTQLPVKIISAPMDSSSYPHDLSYLVFIITLPLPRIVAKMTSF